MKTVQELKTEAEKEKIKRKQHEMQETIKWIELRIKHQMENSDDNFVDLCINSHGNSLLAISPLHLSENLNFITASLKNSGFKVSHFERPVSDFDTFTLRRIESIYKYIKISWD